MTARLIDLDNCLSLLRACASRPRTEAELLRAIGVSRATLFRVLGDVREQFGARIVKDDGKYSVQDWGIIDPVKAGRVKRS